MKNSTNNPRILWTGLFLYVLLLLFSIFIHKWQMNEIGFTAVLGLAGLMLGWAIGFLITPKNWQNIIISKGSLGLTAFVIGYLFAKIEGTIWFFFEGNILIHKPEYGARFLIFLICVLISTMNMYVYGQNPLDALDILNKKEEEKDE
ncbi:MAG: hypothetical protein EAZ85_08145 [Bacteroidetes bacterium]|nr:MAG: hypothetical protein EAZ85_08145 [Bacteroidota bacterium]TAG86801.1 MAG: hypothetical protein EAZ20_12040 [Bacteroidota bacterium]